MPARTPNRRGEGARLRAEILAAARVILEETGSDDAVTLRAVARGAGITAPAIYSHFPDRSAILRSLVETTFAELTQALGAAAHAHADPGERLQAVGRAYLDFAEEHPHHYRVLFERHRSESGNLHGSTSVNTDVRTMVGADAFGVLLDACAAHVHSLATEHGPNAVPEAPELVADRVWIGLHGLATLRASLPWHPWPDRDELADDLLRRLTAPSDR